MGTNKDLKYEVKTTEKTQEESQETTTIEWTSESTTTESTPTNKENPRVQTNTARKHPQTYIWEPKAPSNTTVTNISTTESPKEKTEAQTEKPHRGGIFKKENVLKYGLPRPTTGPRRGGLFKKNRL